MSPRSIACCLAWAASAAQALPPAGFLAESEPGFRPVGAALGAYLDALPPSAVGSGPQRFCVLGRGQGDTRHAWVIWLSGQRLVHWEPAAAGMDSKQTLVHSRRDLDLRRDVVDGTDRLRGSSYMVDRAWLNRLQAECRQRGQQYIVPRP